MRYIFLLLFANTVLGQELNCEVEINTTALRTSQNNDPQVFSDLQRAVSGFMNNQKWTNDVFEQNEKIKCKLTINLITSPEQNVFNGNAQFLVLRPVYGTSYETITFQYIDNAFNFSFAPAERQMVFNEQVFTNNLTSILAFYSLIALVVDYDSFEKLGGSEFVTRAFNIVQLAQRTGERAWSSEATTRSRYWIVENLQSQPLRRFREGFYEYHRLHLDEFGKDPLRARTEILNYLTVIQNLVLMRPNVALINVFFDAKVNELVHIFSEGDQETKQKAFLLLSNLDPDKTEVYRKIVQ